MVSETNSRDELIVHQVNIAHYRLVELTRLSDLAKPFYDWIERKFKQEAGTFSTLNDIIMTSNRNDLRKMIRRCYEDSEPSKPFLFDGIGRTYPHRKACFYFFAWIIRDAPQQRLNPLITRMTSERNLSRLEKEYDTLSELIFEYRTVVKSFDWLTVREVILDRLEGSRRSISGHGAEAFVRAGVVTAFQNFYSIFMNYGKYSEVIISDRQIKIGRHTVDVSVTLNNANRRVDLVIPVKTRETEGGGHSHLFSRDLITAIKDIKELRPDTILAVVIIAQNWSVSEIDVIQSEINRVFYYDMNPNMFNGFDEKSQIEFNRFVEEILNDEG